MKQEPTTISITHHEARPHPISSTHHETRAHPYTLLLAIIPHRTCRWGFLLNRNLSDILVTTCTPSMLNSPLHTVACDTLILHLVWNVSSKHYSLVDRATATIDRLKTIYLFLILKRYISISCPEKVHIYFLSWKGCILFRTRNRYVPFQDKK